MNESTASQARHSRTVPTSKLLLYMATVFAWEAEIAVLLLRIAGGVVVPPVLRYSVLALYVVITLLAVRYGKEDFQRIKASRGKIELTGLQMVFVTLFVLSISIPVAFIAIALTEE